MPTRVFLNAIVAAEKHPFNLLASMLGAFLLSGCSTQARDYPPFWPQLTAVSKESSALSGDYSAKCDCRESYWGQIKKTPLSTLFQDDSLSDVSADHFSISFPAPGILEISGGAADKVAFIKRYVEGRDYEYKDGNLTLTLGSHPMGGVALTPVPIWGAGSVSNKLVFSLDKDGSLIGQLIENTFGLVWFILPSAQEANMWCRCERAVNKLNSG